jgi:hypothetical protein
LSIKPVRFIIGIVIEPVVIVLAIAPPEIVAINPKANTAIKPEPPAIFAVTDLDSLIILNQNEIALIN